MANDWSMPRRGEACGACGRAFEAGQPVCVYLYEAAERYARRDFCESCQPPAEPAWLGAWKTRRPVEGRKPPALDRESLLKVFEQLDAAAAAETVQFRFVLALLLWRKRVLKLEGTSSNGPAEEWDFTGPGDRKYRITRPDLDETQLELLSNQLEALLAGQSDAALPAELAAPGEDPS